MICYVVTLDFAKILKTYEYYILSYRFFIQSLIIEVHGMLYVGHISVGDCDSFNEFFKKLTDLFCARIKLWNNHLLVRNIPSEDKKFLKRL